MSTSAVLTIREISTEEGVVFKSEGLNFATLQLTTYDNRTVHCCFVDMHGKESSDYCRVKVVERAGAFYWTVERQSTTTLPQGGKVLVWIL